MMKSNNNKFLTQLLLHCIVAIIVIASLGLAQDDKVDGNCAAVDAPIPDKLKSEEINENDEGVWCDKRKDNISGVMSLLKKMVCGVFALAGTGAGAGADGAVVLVLYCWVLGAETHRLAAPLATTIYVRLISLSRGAGAATDDDDDDDDTITTATTTSLTTNSEEDEEVIAYPTAILVSNSSIAIDQVDVDDDDDDDDDDNNVDDVDNDDSDDDDDNDGRSMPELQERAQEDSSI